MRFDPETRRWRGDACAGFANERVDPLSKRLLFRYLGIEEAAPGGWTPRELLGQPLAAAAPVVSEPAPKAGYRQGCNHPRSASMPARAG